MKTVMCERVTLLWDDWGSSGHIFLQGRVCHPSGSKKY